MKILAIFADYGIDDAAATVSIFNSHTQFDEIAIIPIAGNSINNAYYVSDKIYYED